MCVIPPHIDDLISLSHLQLSVYRDRAKCQLLLFLLLFNTVNSTLTIRCSEDSDDDDYSEVGDTDSKHTRRHKRCLLSTSLDVDPRLPYRSELKGFPPGLDSHRIGIPKSATAEDHQTILLTSMVMGMGEGREGKVLS